MTLNKETKPNQTIKIQKEGCTKLTLTSVIKKGSEEERVWRAFTIFMLSGKMVQTE